MTEGDSCRPWVMEQCPDCVRCPREIDELQVLVQPSCRKAGFASCSGRRGHSAAAFGASHFGELGGGWPGVYRWCRQSAEERGGSVLNSTVLRNHDLVIVQVDADVAKVTYASGNVLGPATDDLPCEEPCPPASATTNRLRAVVSNWLGLTRGGPVVLCIPSKNMDTWMVAAVLPDFVSAQGAAWECVYTPLSRLPKALRFPKSQQGYEAQRGKLTNAWAQVSSQLHEAARFERDFRSILPTSG